ncbi:ead/Ea22-like family protein [Citrobacter freundii]|uniref:ead/Ea22-like family protein n=1 Tax=Citrobacter freundii TaxID=546 RepID=UPI0015E94989|nr:ead/Ea22-like family protein [Citrobacter freundii]QLY52658.1 ead/Ea22-like family protein [Citrobacter freundii]
MTALNKQALRSKARSASAGEWIKESGDGWEAICSSDDQANGNFIIAHFEGPDAKANREFSQAANPDTVLELLDELEAAEKRIAEQREYYEGVIADGSRRIAELEARTVVVKQFDDFQMVHYGGSEDYAKGYIDCQNNYNKALTAAGIGVKGE